MSQGGLLYDYIADAWAALTNEQRICWHFTAAKNPVTLQNGDLFTLNGWQYFTDINTLLAVIDPALMLTDPPSNNEKPNTPDITADAWPLPVKLGTGGSTRRAPPRVRFFWPRGNKKPATVKQGYTQFVGAHAALPQTQRISAVNASGQHWITTGTTGEYLTTGVATAQRPEPAKQNKKPAIRHVTVYEEGDPDEFGLDVSLGYYALTAGNNRFGKIRGKTARRRPDLPLGKVTFINPINGATVEKTIPNPTGGSPTDTSRPRNYP